MFPPWVAAKLLPVKSIVKKIPYQVWIVVGVIVLLSFSHWYTYQRGKSVIQTRWDAAVKAGKDTGKTLHHVVTWEMADVTVVYKDRIKVIHEKGDTIIKEVPVYFSDLPELPGQYRVQHDAAATGTPASPQRYASAAPVPAEDFARILTENYTGCRQNSAQVISLQEAYQGVREKYLALCKQPGVRCSTDN